jgi:excisionase family DNA binding protein
MDRLTYSPFEVAQTLGVPRRRIYYLISMSKIPAVKVSGMWRIRANHPAALSLNECAQALGISKKTVRRIIASGELNTTLIDKRIRILFKDLITYLSY